MFSFSPSVLAGQDQAEGLLGGSIPSNSQIFQGHLRKRATHSFTRKCARGALVSARPGGPEGGKSTEPGPSKSWLLGHSPHLTEQSWGGSGARRFKEDTMKKGTPDLGPQVSQMETLLLIVLTK